MSKTNCLLPEVIVDAPYSLIHLATCQTAKCIVLEIVRNVNLNTQSLTKVIGIEFGKHTCLE